MGGWGLLLFFWPWEIKTCWSFPSSSHFISAKSQNKINIQEEKKKLLSVFWILLGQKSLRSDVSGHLVCFFVSSSQPKDGIEIAKALISAVWGIKSPAIHLSLGQILKRKALRSLFLSPSTFFFFSQMCFEIKIEMKCYFHWFDVQIRHVSSNFFLLHLLCSKYQFWSILHFISLCF